jgi:hypothetical protein
VAKTNRPRAALGLSSKSLGLSFKRIHARLRGASLKRYLAKRFHPDFAPGQGIEKVVRNEIFKEIWNEIDRIDQAVSATRFATARSSWAA